MRLKTIAEVAAVRCRAQPKPRPRLDDHTEAIRADERELAAFRFAVCVRDGWRCRVCHRRVVRSLALIPERAEVHHLAGRSKAHRYAVNMAILVCCECHGKLTRHDIDWKEEAP
jgi:hypothetical protein